MKIIVFNGVSDTQGENDQEVYTPLAIVASEIRSFSPRRHGRPGTRIVFHNGVGLPVKETFEEVLAVLQPN